MLTVIGPFIRAIVGHIRRLPRWVLNAIVVILVLVASSLISGTTSMWIQAWPIVRTPVIVTGLSILFQVLIPRFLVAQISGYISLTFSTLLLFILNMVALFTILQFDWTFNGLSITFIVLIWMVPFWASVVRVWGVLKRTGERLVVLAMAAPYTLICLIFFLGAIRLTLYVQSKTVIELGEVQTIAAILTCGADVYANVPTGMAACSLDVPKNTLPEFGLWFLSQVFSSFFIGAAFATFGGLLFQEKRER